jgi:hypothetical protein
MGKGTEQKAIAAYRKRYHEAKRRVRATKIRRSPENFPMLFVAPQPSLEAKNGHS